MRVRLQGIVVTLVALLVFGLGIPLALSLASHLQQQLFLDRLTDTSRFASLAQRPLLDNRIGLLEPELRRYTEVYGVKVVVVNQDGDPILSSLGGTDAERIDRTAIDTPVNKALAARPPEAGPLLMPWASAPLVLAEPILIDGEVRGAVVTESATDHIRTQLLWQWLLLAAASLVAFGLALLVALPVVRWTLRPVRRLDEATGALVASVVSGREAEPVGESGGPPELRQLGRSFDRMAASVSEALAAQRAFVADASHQLRNPLTALKIRLGNLDGQVTDETAAADLEAAQVDAKRLNQILDELLSMARAEAAGGELVSEDLAAVIADRVADWSVVGAAREVGLTSSVEVDGAHVLVPPRGLEVVLDALLDNALKFSPSGSTVEVAARVEGSRATVSIRDHGPGLREEELERATDRFWRSSAHQNVPGSGLGLAIVTEIVRHSGGDVQLSLPEGGGLRIAMDFPAEER